MKLSELIEANNRIEKAASRCTKYLQTLDEQRQGVHGKIATLVMEAIQDKTFTDYPSIKIHTRVNCTAPFVTIEVFGRVGRCDTVIRLTLNPIREPLYGISGRARARLNCTS